MPQPQPKIEKVKENEVVVTRVKELKDATGKTVYVYDEENKEHYGENGNEERLRQLEEVKNKLTERLNFSKQQFLDEVTAAIARADEEIAIQNQIKQSLTE